MAVGTDESQSSKHVTEGGVGDRVVTRETEKGERRKERDREERKKGRENVERKQGRARQRESQRDNESESA